jgi:hypothetical protein
MAIRGDSWLQRRANSGRYMQIPYANEQGISGSEQGIAKLHQRI